MAGPARSAATRPSIWIGKLEKFVDARDKPAHDGLYLGGLNLAAETGRPMPTFSIHRAKTILSALIERACAGEEIIIARGKTPVVRLVPVCVQRSRKFGAMRGRARTGAAFFEPIPEEELRAWERRVP
jgi:antitoxin (DNA-binding transcriptional repressor) of toxin-antitoxin stability system